MTKKTKRFQDHVVVTRRRNPVVDVVPMDTLGIYSDEDLSNRLTYLYSKLERQSDPEDRRDIEVEIAYVMREFDIRRERKVVYKAYLDAMRVEEVDESTLPEYQGNPPPYWLN